MKIGIFYASKTGTTKKCAQMIHDHFPDSDLIELDGKEIYLEDYDYIIVGSPVIAGSLHKHVKKFLKLHKELLIGKIGYFLCHGFKLNAHEVIKRNVDIELAKNTKLISCFGGEIHLDKLKGIDKFMVKLITRSKKYVEPKLDLEAINIYIDCLNQLIGQEV